MNNTSEQRELEWERETDRHTHTHKQTPQTDEGWGWLGLGSRQNSYWISLSVMLTSVQTQTHTHTRRHGHTDAQTYRQLVSSWVFISCEPHKVTPYVHKTDHKIQISLCQFKPKVTELEVKRWIIVIGKNSQQQTRSCQKQSITSTSQYLHFTWPQPTGISRFSRRNVRTIYNVWIRRRREHATSLKSQTSLIQCFNTWSRDYLYSKRQTNR